MKFKFIFLFTAAVMLYISPSPVNFASDGDQELSLWISPLSIYFPPADPDTDPVIVSDSLVLVEITAPAGTNWRLTIAANGDLRAGQGGRIPIENISWTASPSPSSCAGPRQSWLQRGKGARGSRWWRPRLPTWCCSIWCFRIWTG